MPDETSGPWLAMAVLCEKVIESKTGVLSVINVIDRIVISPGGPQVPEQMPTIPIQATAAIMFKSGFATTQYTMRMTLSKPSSEEEELVASCPMLFEGSDRGVNLILNLRFDAKEQGLYWFNVYLEDQRFTRVPLRLIYQRIGFGPSAH